MFNEIKTRKNGREEWVDEDKWVAKKVEKWMKVNYKGKSVDPYEVRVNKFYDNIPKDLIEMWSKAYPNVDIRAECSRCRAWLLSNTNKAKKDFKNFTNRWLGKACQSGGIIPVNVDRKLDLQMKRHKEYVEQSQEDEATFEERQEIINKIKNRMKWKKKTN